MISTAKNVTSVENLDTLRKNVRTNGRKNWEVDSKIVIGVVQCVEISIGIGDNIAINAAHQNHLEHRRKELVVEVVTTKSMFAFFALSNFFRETYKFARKILELVSKQDELLEGKHLFESVNPI